MTKRRAKDAVPEAMKKFIAEPSGILDCYFGFVEGLGSFNNPKCRPWLEMCVAVDEQRDFTPLLELLSTIAPPEMIPFLRDLFERHGMIKGVRGTEASVEHEGWHNPGPDKSHRDSTKKMTEEAETKPNAQMGEREFEHAKEESHAPSKRGGNFSPVQSEIRNPVGDAAVAMRQRQEQVREKQASVSDDMKRHSRAQYDRNANIAAAMKAASARQWGNK